MLEEEKAIKLKNRRLVILTCLISSLIIFGINLALDFILKDQSIGHIKNIIIPIIVILTAYIFLIIKNKMVVNKKAYFYLIPIAFIGIGSIVLNIPFSNKFLNTFILPILATIFLFSLTNKNYDIAKWPLSIWTKLFPKGLFKNLKYLKPVKEEQNNKNIINILKGLLIGIPIAILIISLLTSADKYFSEFIVRFFNHFLNFKISKVNDVLKIITTSFIAFSIFINVIKCKNLKIENKDLEEINNATSITVLSIINFIFLIFIISEVSKLTNNFLHLPIEYTYANYAREGFFQLLLITAINFLTIGYHTYKTKGFEKSKMIKWLLITLISFSIILIFNSYYRMFLYIGAFGFTTLRMQVILFLLMELILFSVLVKKIIEKTKHSYKKIFIIVMIVFYILNIYMASGNFLSFLKTF